MTRRDRILALLYISHSLWSAWCAVQQYTFHNLPVAAAFLLASLIPILALVEQNELLDHRGTVRFYEARHRARQRHEAQLKRAGLHRVDGP
ncbi:hypothetical protein ACFUEN_29140 [Streptomyces griseorubiginosus]|uniref:hypothetical protein n=1 Tax=Streptomyces griseorubiginosus TaxID=67304 RepID=UPI00363BF6B9